jgi:hypothetical protein
MNSKLMTTILNSRQFVCVLLTLFSLASMISTIVSAQAPPEDSLARLQLEWQRATTYNFVPPSAFLVLIAFVGVTTFLALVNLWFCFRDKQQLT